MFRVRVALLLLTCSISTAARANGAFPDSLGVFLPADRPGQIIAVTNFGLLISNDSGSTWEYVCEEAIGPRAIFYQLGAVPENRITAVSNRGLVSSTEYCHFTESTLPSEVSSVFDAFPDRAIAGRVLFVARLKDYPDGGTGPMALFESNNGAQSFGGPLYVSADDSRLYSVETAISDPNRLYMAMDQGDFNEPKLVRSDDHGAHFQVIDLVPFFGQRQVVKIITVDPTDPGRVFFRVTNNVTNEEMLAVTDDGATTMRTPLTMPAQMTAFLRRDNGDIWVADSSGKTFLSKDNATTFEELSTTLHFRGLAERGGRIVAVADNFLDGFAVGFSEDDGQTWSPLLRFADIKKARACVEDTCASPLLSIRTTFGSLDTEDAGPTVEETPPKSGCHCAQVDAGSILAFGFALSFLYARRRQ